MSDICQDLVCKAPVPPWLNKSAAPAIDVIIPVYNAPELTRRCIDSVIGCLGQSIGAVYVHNDASDRDTREMLDSLPYPQVHVYHAPENQGYGKSVNEAVARSNAELVLVLNSDTEVHENFLPKLCQALEADPALAVVSPATDHVIRYDSKRYLQQPGGYITTYRFKGYAFLIRRSVFIEMGGFDPEFGRGYFEDTDLGRRLIRRNWHMGVHPETYIRHEAGASFGRGRSYRLLVQRNHALYLSRYPEVLCNILIVSGDSMLTESPAELSDAVKSIVQQGSGVHWLTSTPLMALSCLQIRNSRLNAGMIIRLMLRGKSRRDKRISSVWILPGVSGWLHALLLFFARLQRLEIKYLGSTIVKMESVPEK